MPSEKRPQTLEVVRSDGDLMVNRAEVFADSLGVMHLIDLWVAKTG